MEQKAPKTIDEISVILTQGGVGVMPTDTIYGLIGSAFSEKAVDRIYKLKRRDTKKPFIILINSVQDLEKFFIFPNEPDKKVLAEVWPGKVTVILPCNSNELSYLHRGSGSLAFRVSDKTDLRYVIRTSGPLVAPSANIEGQSPAETVEEARKSFGDMVDFYQDGGLCHSVPSTIISLSDGTYQIVRSGAGDDIIKKLAY